MKHTLTIVATVICTTLGLQANAWHSTGTRASSTNPKKFTYERNCKNPAATCTCDWHRYLRRRQSQKTVEAEAIFSQGGRLEVVRNAGNGKIEVTTKCLCKMCNGTGRSMNRTCTSCKGAGVQIRVQLKPMPKGKRNIYTQ